jgi:hypothetical protein
MAGPSGSVTTTAPFDRARIRRRWDTASARHEAKGRPFRLSMGVEETPGVPSCGPYRQVVGSEATILWNVSLEPFAAELPRDCGWMGFAELRQPTGDDAQRVRDWRYRDSRNSLLVEALPVRFVRSRVIDDANEDLGVGLANGTAVSADRLHQRVMFKRFEEDSGWQFGFAIGIVLPQVTELPWDAISELRRHRDIEYLRQTLREVEAETLSSLGSGPRGGCPSTVREPPQQGVWKDRGDGIAGHDLRRRSACGHRVRLRNSRGHWPSWSGGGRRTRVGRRRRSEVP